MCARTAAAGERGRPGDGIPLSRLWPKTWRVLEQGISLLREGASIAFVWTPASAAAPPNANPGQKPGPTLERKNGGTMNKDTTFSIRIASSDLDTIRKKAKQARMSQSDYVTRCCLGRQVVVIEDLKETAKQLRAIGGSLNRLTVLANMGRVEIANLDGLARELARVSTALREIQERGRWNR